MRSLMFAALALVATALSACASLPPGLGVPPAPIVSTRATLVDEKAYAEALNAYDAAASIYLHALPALPAEAKTRAKASLQTARKALRVAKGALATANAPTFTAQLAAALAAVADARALLPKG